MPTYHQVVLYWSSRCREDFEYLCFAGQWDVNSNVIVDHRDSNQCEKKGTREDSGALLWPLSGIASCGVLVEDWTISRLSLPSRSTTLSGLLHTLGYRRFSLEPCSGTQSMSTIWKVLANLSALRCPAYWERYQSAALSAPSSGFDRGATKKLQRTPLSLSLFLVLFIKFSDLPLGSTLGLLLTSLEW